MTARTASQEALPLPVNRVFEAGHLRVELATESWQLEGAQSLRYRSLYVESGGVAEPRWIEAGREFDEWDPVAWHVIVTDKRKARDESVVGTLRLTANFNLGADQVFYTEQAYDLQRLRDHYGRMLELSRFCIDAGGRSGSILLMIWRFTMQLIVDNQFDVMLGCASFKGKEVDQHRAILSWLYENNLAPESLMPTVRAGDSFPIADIYTPVPVEGEAMRSVPTLLRGYLKIGAKISDTAVIDHLFNTTFVSIYVDAREMVAGQHKLVSPANRD